MKKNLIVLLLILATVSLRAQSGEDRVVMEQQVYKRIQGFELTVDMFYAEGAMEAGIHPAIAFFHGGGWATGDPSEFHEACLRYARHGMITFSFRYRLSVNTDGTIPHPGITPVECVKDARSAMRWIREHAAELHVDPERVVACGQSAGGQLALSTALAGHVNEATDNLTISPVPDALILYSSNVNTLEAWADMLMGERREEIWSISPQHNLKPGLPPTIEFHGEEDGMVPIWVVRHFIDTAEKMGNTIEFVPFEGRQHYLGDGDDQYGRYYDEEVLERTDRFLREHGFMDR
ncbi:MAG: alpha/beta hydrolase [Bacteroidales bacterium]